MKLLPTWLDTASRTNSAATLYVRSLPSVHQPDEPPSLAVLAQMVIYSRALAADSAQPSAEGTANSTTSIPIGAIIGGVVGAVVVLLICIGIYIMGRVRYGKRPSFWSRFGRSTSGTCTAHSQKTLCSPEDGFPMEEKGKGVGVVRSKASFLSEHSQVESIEETPTEPITLRTPSKRPTIEIDTNWLPTKLRKCMLGSDDPFPEQKQKQVEETGRGPTPTPMTKSNLGDDPTNRHSVLSTYSYTLSLQLSRPSTSLSESSMQTISPIAFCETPSNSHLPLALKPKPSTSNPEEGQPQDADESATKDPASTSSSSPST